MKKTEPLSFKNNQAIGVELAGTQTFPEGKGLFPVAILILGSGPQYREKIYMVHKLLLLLPIILRDFV
jgi:hypothetical protein